jgi:hypothetical protein
MIYKIHFSHPSLEALDLLRRHGARLFLTLDDRAVADLKERS